MAKNIEVTLELDNKQYNRALKQSQGQTNTFGKSAKSSMAGVASAFAAIGGAAVIKSIVDIGSRFEDLQNSLNVVFGSANRGAQAFERVQEFAKGTQFSVQTLTQAFVQLKGAGVEPTDKLLSTFANTAAVTTDSMGTLQAMVDLVTRSTSGGMGLEDLNRLADRGVPVFAILEEKLGKTRLELTEFGKTAEGSAKILDALAQGLDERFGSALTESENNLSRLTNNLGDAFDTLANEIFKIIDDDLKEGIKGLTTIIEDLATGVEKLNEAGYELGDLLKVLVAGLLFIFNPFSKLKIATSGLSKVFGGFGTKLRNSLMHLGPMRTAIDALRGPLERIVSVVGGLKLFEWLFGEDVEKSVPQIKKGEKSIEEIKDEVAAAADAAKVAKEEYAKLLEPFSKYIELAQKFAGTDYRDEQEKVNDRVTEAREVLEKLREAFLATGRAADEYNTFLEENGTSLDAMVSELAAAVFAQADFNQKVEDAVDNLSDYDKFLVSLLQDTKAFSDSQKFAAQALEFLGTELAQGAMTAEEMSFAMEKLYGILGMDMPGISAFEDFEDRLEGLKLTTEEYNEQQRQLLALITKYPELIDQAIDAQDALDDAFSGNEGLNSFLDALGSAQVALSEDLASAFLEGESAGDSFQKFFKKMVKQIIADILRLQIIQPILGAIMAPFGFGFGSGGSVVKLPSGDGGGYTGSGARAGGVDGRGGFPAILHPNETVVDHTKGQGMGAVQNTAVTYNINAVSAQSFKDLVAQDPEFIYNVTQVGMRRQPR